jgi:alkanesulfonate monooxygenase SsuD/methylene tetrahydromethanopterin reductase-like flavin-dependent oxidoreductase (luciferase family)
VAASTSTIKVGTWILSALHRNAGITAKIVETVDEISGGRFVFGLGAGHTWPGQAHAFGLPEDHIHSRFDEALRIIVPLLRGGRADFAGSYHTARDLEQRPLGPRPGRIPLMIGGHGPKMLRLAATHADIWSAYAEQRDDVEEFIGKLAAFEAACAEVGRDPATVGKSAGISIAPAWRASDGTEAPSAMTGDADAIAEGILAFERARYTQLEILLEPQTAAALEAMAPIIERVRRA